MRDSVWTILTWGLIGLVVGVVLQPDTFETLVTPMLAVGFAVFLVLVVSIGLAIDGRTGDQQQVLRQLREDNRDLSLNLMRTTGSLQRIAAASDVESARLEAEMALTAIYNEPQELE